MICADGRHGERESHEGRVRAIFDVEPTNRCNARCIMCPREKTPEMGLMERATFQQVVARAVEYGRVETVVLCGLGEPMLHPDIAGFVRMASEAGLQTTIVTNGSLLTEEKARALVDAGLGSLNLSVGGFTRETYEHVHRGLKFREVYENGLNFVRIAKGRTKLNVQISPTEQTIAEAEDMAAFWRANGARFCFIFPLAATRGAAVAEDNLPELRCEQKGSDGIPRGCLSIYEVFRPTRHDAEIMRRRADFVCFAKDRVGFISWQGNYHLCCNDYEKRHAVGSVHDMSAEEAFLAKACIFPGNNALCADCGFSAGDLKPRDVALCLRVGSHILGSFLAGLAKRTPRPEFGPAGDAGTVQETAS